MSPGHVHVSTGRRGGSAIDQHVRDVFIVGDAHGHRETLIGLLQDAGLIGRDLAWNGGESRLWLIGDLVDRGPDGIGVINLAMRLQREAAATGGAVDALLGNHDMLLLSAQRFGTAPSSGPGGTFVSAWRRNGGEIRDLVRLAPEHVRWLESRPAMAREGDDLLIHADARFYAHYGHSISEVNQALQALLRSSDPARWDRLLDEFSEHRAFIGGERGEARAAALLHQFGGSRIVHGHTPISSITKAPAATVRAPFVYANGLCVDVDGGIYLGGPGFV